MPLQRINPPTLSQPRGFTHVVKSGSHVWIAGQTGRQLDGKVGADITSQAEQTYKNLGEALKAAGCSYKDVTKVTVFMTHREDIEAARAVRAKYFGNTTPASTLVLVSGLADPVYRIEVEATAVVP